MEYYHKVNGKLTPEDAEDCVRAAIASNRLEGLETPPEEEEMLRKYANGMVTDEECMAWALRRAGVYDEKF